MPRAFRVSPLHKELPSPSIRSPRSAPPLASSSAVARIQVRRARSGKLTPSIQPLARALAPSTAASHPQLTPRPRQVLAPNAAKMRDGGGPRRPRLDPHPRPRKAAGVSSSRTPREMTGPTPRYLGHCRSWWRFRCVIRYYLPPSTALIGDIGNRLAPRRHRRRRRIPHSPLPQVPQVLRLPRLSCLQRRPPHARHCRRLPPPPTSTSPSPPSLPPPPPRLHFRLLLGSGRWKALRIHHLGLPRHRSVLYSRALEEDSKRAIWRLVA